MNLQETITKLNVWKPVVFKFSNFKHPDVKIVSDYVVKSSNNSGYKFAIMEPNL
jgi:hypothetical protein